ncbi:MAG: hypothetical protein IPK21_16325 [Haliscomenobacter sp.]|nr:hypothetical protein [Haliscomenobacter sp.]
MKKIKLLFFLALSTLLTGCFNILEEVTLNQDGSGALLTQNGPQRDPCR